MNPENQRIKIAEACGWKPCTKGCDGSTWRYPDDSGCTPNLPDYLNDLNAMDEAEKVIMEKGLWYRYCDSLTAFFLSKGDDRTAFMHATAAQRAEAFLRTFNLWEDAQ